MNGKKSVNTALSTNQAVIESQRKDAAALQITLFGRKAGGKHLIGSLLATMASYPEQRGE